MHFAVFNLHFGYESFEVFVGYFLQLFQPPEDPVVLFLYCTHFTEYQRQHFMVFSLEYENEDISTDTAAHLVQGYLLDGVLQLAHLCPHPGPAALTPGPGACSPPGGGGGGAPVTQVHWSVA